MKVNDERMKAAQRAFTKLYTIIGILRSDCPWDREQKPYSMRQFLIEEAFECVDAIENDDLMHMKEELGDVFLVVLMISYMLEETSDTSVSAILDMLSDKLVRRHPHIFSRSANSPMDAAAVERQWNTIKQAEKRDNYGKKDTTVQENIEHKDRDKDTGALNDKGILDNISLGLSPLQRALEIQKRVSRVGFDWKRSIDIVEKIREELNEIMEYLSDDDALADNRHEPALTEELGDLLFSVVNLARFLSINPSLAMHSGNNKFIRRFQELERRMVPLNASNLTEMEMHWNAIKTSERAAEH